MAIDCRGRTDVGDGSMVAVRVAASVRVLEFSGIGALTLTSTRANESSVAEADQRLAGHLIGEYQADGTVLREYVWLADQPLALLRPGSGLLGGTEAFYYHVDQLNTPQQLTDATGRVVWAGIQQPFGEVEVTVAEVEQNLRFPGQQYDAETGLHYNYFRDYDPGVGRYRESDPIWRTSVDIPSSQLLRQGPDLRWSPGWLLRAGIKFDQYGYVASRPIHAADPLGLWCGSGLIQDMFIPDSPFGHEFSDACAMHDSCYSKCGSKKADCDFAFMEAAMFRCASKSWFEGRGGCIALASFYYGSINKLGQGPYDRAQSTCEGCK